MERLENRYTSGPGFDTPYYYFEVRGGFGRIPVRRDALTPRQADGDQDTAHITPENTEPGQSILRERRDPENYPIVTGLAQMFRQIRLYREWNIGRRSQARMPQPTDGEFEVLLEDFSNLALVMNRLQGGKIRSILDAHLRRFCEQHDSLHPRVEGGTIQLTVVERGLGGAVIPATRLSDGTIRFISLLAILCNPKPPPLLCIEEPELALHPDVIPLVAELLRDASQRTQLIVTTHSRDLIDQFTDEPESVVVCERGFDSATQMSRLSKPDLEEWLERYTLGHLGKKERSAGPGGKRNSSLLRRRWTTQRGMESVFRLNPCIGKSETHQCALRWWRFKSRDDSRLRNGDSNAADRDHIPFD